jgi:hypothetical protein
VVFILAILNIWGLVRRNLVYYFFYLMMRVPWRRKVDGGNVAEFKMVIDLER